jgi:F-type H+-transporting ATPase subunit b
MANLFLLASEAADHGAKAAHAEPMAFGFISPGMWVALAMTVLILIMVWKKVPGMVVSGLDASIAQIKQQLDEAKALRAEAEALRNEYAAKIAGAEKDAAAMLDHARSEAEAIVAKAEADTKALIKRREKMAADKIAAAERAALDELRAKAADAATKAAGSLIASGHDAKADKALVDQAIAGL